MTHPYEAQLAGLFGHLVPEIVLVVVACVLFLGGLMIKADRLLWGATALAGLLLSLALLLAYPARQNLSNHAVFGVPVLFDSLANWTRVLALATGVILVLLAWDEVPEKQVAEDGMVAEI